MMKSHGIGHRLYYLPLLLFVVMGLVMPVSCLERERVDVSELQAFEAFFDTRYDSITIAPRQVRTEAINRMRACRDSLAGYNYLALALKTCLATSDIDSARLLIRQIEAFARRQPPSAHLADLYSECLNMKGNVYARLGQMDSAENCFRQAYEQRMKGERTDVVPDILINLADACNRQGKLDISAYWYRRALLLCDSLQLLSKHKVPIYYGLAQVYSSLRDFELCDHYYDLAAQSFGQMLPFEKHFYLNNRGTSYYYRGDYLTAIRYFRRAEELTDDYPDMNFELNLSRLNLSDCFLQQGEADSAAKYLDLCQPFFHALGMNTALYYLDTQHIQLALLRRDYGTASRLLKEGVPADDIDPDLVHIRNRYLQQFHEATGNYRQAYHYMKENARLDDSIRNERIRMHTADLTLRYQQDSTLMAHRVLLQEQRNEVLELRQTQFIVWGIAVLSVLIACFVYIYTKKKRALLLAQNRRTVSTLRLENIRNRLSPHFIFNVLNQEMAGLKEAERQDFSSLVKLMRRNLELAEHLCVTLAEELDFVRTYLELMRRSLGPDFHPDIKLEPDVRPDEVVLPSMLIQIPVENAVKHALKDKEGARRLWITVHKVVRGIDIRITDNGGGFRPGSIHRGTGTGLKVIMQTIQILNQKNREAIDVSVQNIDLPDGEVGCCVFFHLPEHYDYTL